MRHAIDDGSTDRSESRKTMRVLLVNQYYAPSDAPTARLLADVGAALAAGGHDVSAICSQRGYRDASIRFPKHDTIDGVEVARLPSTGFTQLRLRGRIGNYLSFFISAGLKLLTTKKPDVVVCLSTPPLLASVVQVAARLRGIRMVYWVMDVHPELAFRLGQIKKNSLIGRMLNRVARYPLKKADVTIALGDDMASRLEPYSNGHTCVVHNWADGDLIRPADNGDNRLRTEWGWDGKFIVAYQGNMGLVHEFDTILDAATQLADDERYLFCFIGGGPRAADIKDEVEKRALSNVEFRDYVPDDQLVLSLTAPNVHLVSLRENLAGLSVPSKTYGILAAGKAVAFIGPHDSDIASIIDENACGVHIANGDGDSLARALRDYVESPDVLVAHQEAARRTFDAKYTRDQGLTSMISLIAD